MAGLATAMLVNVFTENLIHRFKNMTPLKKLFFYVLLTLYPVLSYASDTWTDEMTYTPQSTTFTLPFPTQAKGITLRLYKEGQGGTPIKTVAMKKNREGLWQTTVEGDLKGMFYTFERQGEGLGESPGLFAKAVGVNGDRGAIIDLSETNPDSWERDDPKAVRQSPLVIYETHFRDISIDPSADFRYPGKFLALQEPKALEHLRHLGITAVHILPSFDYASVDETRLDKPQYNWGYDPKNYNVPEGSYSTNPYQPETRIREFKQMVQALHKAGIRVILDVVYNHTFDIRNSNFNKLYPGVFYRTKADGTPSDGSGCGNETASERAEMRRFMRESVKYWVNEYHIDGFRFDLMGIHDIETMRLIRADLNAIDPNIYIYGEGWSAGSCAYPQEKLAMKANISKLPGIAAFSDELRDGLRGPFSDDHKGGILAGVPGNEESIKFGIVGGVAHPDVDMSKVNYSKTPWALSPRQFISYVSCHDDMCLTDRLRASIPGISEEELIRLDLLAQTAVFTSQGVPFMLAGEELFRTKQGVHNSFNSPDSINVIKWANKERYNNVFWYYEGLIELKKKEKAFNLGTAEAIAKQLRFLSTPSGVIAWRIEVPNEEDKEAEEPETVYVVLNANKTPYTLDVPQKLYRILVENGKPIIWDKAEDTGRFEVAPQSALIIKHDPRVVYYDAPMAPQSK